LAKARDSADFAKEAVGFLRRSSLCQYAHPAVSDQLCADIAALMGSIVAGGASFVVDAL
jgi:hypothetical protein